MTIFNLLLYIEIGDISVLYTMSTPTPPSPSTPTPLPTPTPALAPTPTPTSIPRSIPT